LAFFRAKLLEKGGRLRGNGERDLLCVVPLNSVIQKKKTRKKQTFVACVRYTAGGNERSLAGKNNVSQWKAGDASVSPKTKSRLNDYYHGKRGD